MIFARLETPKHTTILTYHRGRFKCTHSIFNKFLQWITCWTTLLANSSVFQAFMVAFKCKISTLITSVNHKIDAYTNPLIDFQVPSFDIFSLFMPVSVNHLNPNIHPKTPKRLKFDLIIKMLTRTQNTLPTLNSKQYQVNMSQIQKRQMDCHGQAWKLPPACHILQWA